MQGRALEKFFLLPDRFAHAVARRDGTGFVFMPDAYSAYPSPAQVDHAAYREQQDKEKQALLALMAAEGVLEIQPNYTLFLKDGIPTLICQDRETPLSPCPAWLIDIPAGQIVYDEKNGVAQTLPQPAQAWLAFLARHGDSRQITVAHGDGLHALLENRDGLCFVLQLRRDADGGRSAT